MDLQESFESCVELRIFERVASVRTVTNLMVEAHTSARPCDSGLGSAARLRDVAGVGSAVVSPDGIPRPLSR